MTFNAQNSNIPVQPKTHSFGSESYNALLNGKKYKASNLKWISWWFISWRLNFVTDFSFYIEGSTIVWTIAGALVLSVVRLATKSFSSQLQLFWASSCWLAANKDHSWVLHSTASWLCWLLPAAKSWQHTAACLRPLCPRFSHCSLRPTSSYVARIVMHRGCLLIRPSGRRPSKAAWPKVMRVGSNTYCDPFIQNLTKLATAASILYAHDLFTEVLGQQVPTSRGCHAPRLFPYMAFWQTSF